MLSSQKTDHVIFVESFHAYENSCEVVAIETITYSDGRVNRAAVLLTNQNGGFRFSSVVVQQPSH